MIAIRKLQESNSHQNWKEQVLGCATQIADAVETIMVEMSKRPFSVSDGVAVQMATTEALKITLQNTNDGDSSHGVTMRFRVDDNHVLVDIEAPTAGTRQFRSGSSLGTPSHPDALKLMRSYLSEVHVQDSGQRVLLRRTRGQSPVLASPPPGYDYQI